MARLESSNNLATYFVRESRRNDKILRDERDEEEGFVPGQEVEKLLSSLVHQLPNRVYAGSDGRLGRLVFFSDKEEGFRYVAYMEVLNPDESSGFAWNQYRKETIIGNNPQGLEQEITRWRQRFSLEHDLAQKPDGVYVATGLPSSNEVFAHSVMNGEKRITSYYFLSVLGTPRYVGFSRGEVKPEIELSPIASVPEEILLYANPFGTRSTS